MFLFFKLILTLCKKEKIHLLKNTPCRWLNAILLHSLQKWFLRNALNIWIPYLRCCHRTEHAQASGILHPFATLLHQKRTTIMDQTLLGLWQREKHFSFLQTQCNDFISSINATPGIKAAHCLLPHSNEFIHHEGNNSVALPWLRWAKVLSGIPPDMTEHFLFP